MPVRFRITGEMYESAAVGTISTFAGIGLSSILDGVMGTDASNLVGLVFESVIDYYGQKLVFAPKGSGRGAFRAARFLAGKAAAIAVTQGIFVACMRAAPPKYRTDPVGIQVIRLGASVLAWVPHFFLRKYWIFV